MHSYSYEKNHCLLKRERLKTALITGFLLAVFISFTVGDELKELSFLFPEFSISPSVKLDEKNNNKAKNSDDLVVEVDNNDKTEVRFFIVDFFKSLLEIGN